MRNGHTRKPDAGAGSDGVSVPKSRTNLVCLHGAPAEVGRQWGTCNRKAIQNDVDRYFLRKATEAGISEEVLVKRSEAFVEISERIAPHWLGEFRETARAAGVCEDLYVSFVANVYRDLFLHDECTSYAVSPEHTAGNALLFHKTRDNADKTQSAFILESSLPGVNKFIGVTDASVLGCSMMVNDKGLACSADTGGLKVETPRFRGLMNMFMKRHVAERASDCAEALEIIEEFVRKGEYAGGHKTGSHWLFVDRKGVILEISHNSTEMHHVYHKEDVYFSVRGDTAAAERLRAADHPVDFSLFHGVSRDPSICFDSSIAGMTVEIDPDQPDLGTCAWITLPAHSGAVPLLMAGRGTPLPLLNGDAYRAAREQRVSREVWERIERSVHQSKTLFCGNMAASSGTGNDSEDWHSRADEWVENQSEMMMSVFRMSGLKCEDKAETEEPEWKVW